MQLAEVIERVQTDLRRGRLRNEAAVSQGVVLQILQALGWPVFETAVVAPEYTVEGKRVDYALCHPADKPLVFLEAKRTGSTEEGADRQLFEYAFHQGVRMAVLTNGQEWHFYLPAEHGSYADRRVYKLDLLERDGSESANRLRRYLGYGAVCSGEALEAACSDHTGVVRQREIAKYMPRAWERLLQEPDEGLVQRLVEKTEDISGHQPNHDECADFLAGLSQSTGGIPREHPRRGEGTAPPVRPVLAPHETGFVLRGREQSCGAAREILVTVLRLLAEEDPTFLQRFAARKHGHKRRYVASEKAELYRGRPELCEKYSEQLPSGWFVGTNYGRAGIESILQMACEVAGLRFGVDLVIHLGG